MSQAASVGGQAPDFEFTRSDGSAGSLSRLWTRSPLLALWLRQCG